MRHNRKVNHLSRTSSHRKAMLANMASSLIIHKRIRTTTAKGKALRSYVEPLITRCKSDTTHSRRMVFAHLKDKVAVTELFREVATKIADRPGGYTRILKTGSRIGDNADMCVIELVDYNEAYTTQSGGTKQQAKRTRRGRSGASKIAEQTAAPKAIESKLESDSEVPEANQPDAADGLEDQNAETKS